MYKGKTKVLRVKAASAEPVTLEGNEIEEIDTFTYMNTIIDKQGGTDVDVKAWTDKVKGTYIEKCC